MVSSATSPLSTSSRGLAKAIFQADVPEKFVRSLPAQSLYLTIQTMGLESATDLLPLLSLEQYRLILDFDLWHRDTINEECFWKWLAVTDEEESFDQLFRFTKSIDLKLISLMISRHVRVTIFEDKTENPPEAQSYTPDLGHTWLTIDIEDGERHRLMGKLLAFIFETNAEIFYQLTCVTKLTTESQLEEDSYQEKTKRLLGEGLPDYEQSAGINAPANRGQILSTIGNSSKKRSYHTSSIQPLVYQGGFLQPLRSLFDEIKNNDDRIAIESLEGEVTNLANAAFIFFGVDFSSAEDISSLLEYVKGTVNIGLQELINTSGVSARAVYDSVHLTGCYQYGRALLEELRTTAKECRKQLKNPEASDLALLDALLTPPLTVPLFVFESGQQHSTKLSPETKPIETMEEFKQVQGRLRVLHIVPEQTIR